MPQPDAAHRARGRDVKQRYELALQAQYARECDHSPENKDRRVCAPVHNAEGDLGAPGPECDVSGVGTYAGQVVVAP
jgi:hypothetical protein